MSALLESLLGSFPKEQANPSLMKTRAFAWARVSTDMQEERGLSIPEQLRQIREYAEQHGIEIVEEYQEAASAFKKESQRVEFHRMLERANTEKSISAILVHDYSRFSRDSLKARMLIRELRQNGIRVISLNDLEVDPETVAGVYMEAITFAKNEAYSREVAFHTRKGCRANVQTRDPETGWCYKNGGQPLFGYRSERLIRGEEKKGRPLIKSIWVPDDTVVSGKPVHEWARYCLVEVAAKGTSLDHLRDFCNENGIPAPRRKYWGTSTWHSLLHPNALLQYAGYGVWNVRGKNQRMNHPSEWVIVENAHPALITEEEAREIMAVRERQAQLYPWQNGASGGSKDSRFLLSGGLFKCDRCGANMAGFYSRNGKGREGYYYVCGSAQYRRSLGCGKAVFVDKDTIEEAVFEGIQERFEEWSDVRSFTSRVNSILENMHHQDTTEAENIQSRLQEINESISNVRRALEKGLDDIGWANARIRELTQLKQDLEKKRAGILTADELPKLDVAAVQTYRETFSDLLKYASNSDQRQLIRCFVDSMSLILSESATGTTNEPAAHEITINFKAMPALFVKGMGAGARSVNLHQSCLQQGW